MEQRVVKGETRVLAVLASLLAGETRQNHPMEVSRQKLAKALANGNQATVDQLREARHKVLCEGGISVGELNRAMMRVRNFIEQEGQAVPYRGEHRYAYEVLLGTPVSKAREIIRHLT